MLRKGFDISEICDVLEVNEGYVKKVRNMLGSI